MEIQLYIMKITWNIINITHNIILCNIILYICVHTHAHTDINNIVHNIVFLCSTANTLYDEFTKIIYLIQNNT